MNKKTYITNSIPYVNAPPHIGHALEFVQSDAIVRFKRLLGYEVLYLCGSDDNAIKNVQAAEKAGIPTATLVKKNAELFKKLAEKLAVRFDIFQAGSDTARHYPSSRKLWTLCKDKGDIYQKEYKGLYCIGCELFYTLEELDEKGECFEHPGRRLETVSETNYFFRLSKYQSQLLELISSDTLKIIPEKRKNEMLSFLDTQLHDISISRSNTRAKNWGVPVPGDESQRMYVWFDALNIYQSGIGFGWDEENYKTWWPAEVHVIGKGITRFHALYWPAFLLSAGLSVPHSLFVHGYLTVSGQKMSKTVGNVIDPLEEIKKYGTDVIRYYLLKEVPAYDDGDYSESRLKEIYRADLANELGNVLVRLTTLAQKDELTLTASKPKNIYGKEELVYFKSYQFNKVLELIWVGLRELNKTINDQEPWNKTSAERREFLLAGIRQLHEIGYKLLPFLPHTAQTIINKTQGKIHKAPILFPAG